MAIAGMWLALLTHFLIQRSRFSEITHWPSTPAQITEQVTETRPVDINSKYRGPRFFDEVTGHVTYNYQVNGAQFVSHLASPNRSYLTEDFTQQAPLAYYNPNNPSIAVLIPESYQGAFYRKIIVATPLILLALLLIRRNLLSQQ